MTDGSAAVGDRRVWPCMSTVRTNRMRPDSADPRRPRSSGAGRALWSGGDLCRRAVDAPRHRSPCPIGRSLSATRAKSGPAGRRESLTPTTTTARRFGPGHSPAGGRRSGRWCLVRLGRTRWRDRCGPGIRCSRRGRWPPCRVGQDRRAATIAEHDATLEGYAHESLRRRWSRQRLGRAATVGCRPAGQIDIGGGDVGTREGCPIRVRRLAVRESELQSRRTG